MEFEELQQIWDAQKNKPLYVIDEQALHNRILSKKKRAGHIVNTSEVLLIIVNLGSGAFIFGTNLFNQAPSVAMYVLSVWMFGGAVYSIMSRVHRIKGEHKFDRSMRSDLIHAISMATYQVRLSQMMRWNILPVGVLVFLGLWEKGSSLWLASFILIFFIVAFYAGIWEHGIYKSRKRELEVLQSKLDGETSGSHHSA